MAGEALTMSAGSIKAPNSAALRIRSLLCVLRLRLGGPTCFPIASLILLVRLCPVPLLLTLSPGDEPVPPGHCRHDGTGIECQAGRFQEQITGLTAEGTSRLCPASNTTPAIHGLRGEIDATTGVAASPCDPRCCHGLRALWSRRQPGNALWPRGEPGNRDHVLPCRFRPGCHRERG